MQKAEKIILYLRLVIKLAYSERHFSSLHSTFKKKATKMSQKNRLLILFDVISVINKVIALILDVFIHKKTLDSK